MTPSYAVKKGRRYRYYVSRPLISQDQCEGSTALRIPALVKLLIRAHQFTAALLGNDELPFAALAKREGVSPSYFTRLVRLSYLAPDITEAILDGRQPRDLNADKLLAHSRLPLGWPEQRTLLGIA